VAALAVLVGGLLGCERLCAAGARLFIIAQAKRSGEYAVARAVGPCVINRPPHRR
jgi:hypothetical protein